MIQNLTPNINESRCLTKNKPVLQVNKVLQVELFGVLSEVDGVNVLQKTNPTITGGTEGAAS